MDQMLMQQLMSVMMPQPIEVVQPRRMGPGLIEALIMQEVLQAALTQQPLTSDAVGMLMSDPNVHVYELHADGSMVEITGGDGGHGGDGVVAGATPAIQAHDVDTAASHKHSKKAQPKGLDELQQFKKLVDELHKQQVFCVCYTPQQRTAHHHNPLPLLQRASQQRSVLRRVLVLLFAALFVTCIWLTATTDWVDYLRRFSWKTALRWMNAHDRRRGGGTIAGGISAVGGGTNGGSAKEKGGPAAVGGAGGIGPVCLRAVASVQVPRVRPHASGKEL